VSKVATFDRFRQVEAGQVSRVAKSGPHPEPGRGFRVVHVLNAEGPIP